jgi:hypothetical protein
VNKIRCTQCDSTDLEPGFVADLGQGARGFAQWIAGPLEKGWLGYAKTMGRSKLTVYAARCPNCSHLELFAI